MEPRQRTITHDGVSLAVEELGAGPAIVLLHGLTATRRYVVHGSKVLPRKGFRLVSYDARGHGESSPAPEGPGAAAGYGYDRLAADLELVIDEVVGEGRPVLAGHSMGAHTAAAYALAHPERVGALVLIGPAFMGVGYEEEEIERWDELAEGLESGGVEGFVQAYARRPLDPAWRETLLRITRERLSLHRHPEAVAAALREVPRSQPFEGLAELEFLDPPALVVASNDEADPGHPYAVAEAWAERLPSARLASESEGDSPLAWQGGKLSREIASFCQQPDVPDRLSD